MSCEWASGYVLLRCDMVRLLVSTPRHGGFSSESVWIKRRFLLRLIELNNKTS